MSGAPDDRVHWAILYDDQDRRPQIFSGENAEAAARATLARSRIQWGCHLFRSVDIEIDGAERSRSMLAASEPKS